MGDTMIYHPDRGLGDLIWHVPIMRAIAGASGGAVHLIARPSSCAVELLAKDPAFASIRTIPYRRKLMGHIREVHDIFSLCRTDQPNHLWILEKTWRAALGARLAGVRHVHGFGLGAFDQLIWLTDQRVLPKTLSPAHRLLKLESYAALLDVHPEPIVGCLSNLFPRQTPSVPTVRRLAIGVGASEANRVWRPDRLAAFLAALPPAWVVDLLGLPAEQAIADAAIALLGQQAPRPKLQPHFGAPIRDVAQTIANADGFFGTDSGLLNLALGLGVPSLAICGWPMAPIVHPKFAFLLNPDGINAISGEQAADRLQAHLANFR